MTSKNNIPHKDPNWIDNIILSRSPDQFHRNWKNRCEFCLAPCCLLPMFGQPYNYQEGVKSVEISRPFWNNGFVIDKFYLDDEYVQLCPLVIDGKCSIYNDRPLLCKSWKCQMKAISGNNLY